MRNLGRLYIVTRDNDTHGLCVSWIGVRAEWAIQFGFDEPAQWTCRRIGARTIPANLLPLLVWVAVAVAAGKGWHL